MNGRKRKLVGLWSIAAAGALTLGLAANPALADNRRGNDRRPEAHKAPRQVERNDRGHDRGHDRDHDRGHDRGGVSARVVIGAAPVPSYRFEQVLVSPGHYENVWVEPVTRVYRDDCGHVHGTIVEPGHYARVWVEPVYETRRVPVIAARPTVVVRPGLSFTFRF